MRSVVKVGAITVSALHHPALGFFGRRPPEWSFFVTFVFFVVQFVVVVAAVRSTCHFRRDPP